MKSTSYIRNLSSYLILSMCLGILCYAIFLNYKKQIINEHITFLQDQIPRLAYENRFILNASRKNSRFMFSAMQKMNKFEPFNNYLENNIDDLSEENVKEINSFLQKELNTPDLISFEKYQFLNPNSKKKLSEYHVRKFQNELVSASFIYGPCMMFSRDYKIKDFWSQKEYRIHLSYNPNDSFQTKMKINGKQSSDNALLFNPLKTGKHIIDISLSQYNSSGKEKKLNFQKEIMVLP